jgi:hypothetical protein
MFNKKKIILFIIIIFLLILLFLLIKINLHWISKITGFSVVKYGLINGLLLFFISIIFQNINSLSKNASPFLDFSDFLFLCKNYKVRKVVIYNNFLKCFLEDQGHPKKIISDLQKTKFIDEKGDSLMKLYGKKKIKKIDHNHVNDLLAPMPDLFKLKNAYMVYFPKNYFAFVVDILPYTKINFDSLGFLGDYFWMYYFFPMLFNKFDK